jgi:hypothetical protein
MVCPPSLRLSVKVDWRLVPGNSSEPENTAQDSTTQSQFSLIRQLHKSVKKV